MRRLHWVFWVGALPAMVPSVLVTMEALQGGSWVHTLASWVLPAASDG